MYKTVRSSSSKRVRPPAWAYLLVFGAAAILLALQGHSLYLAVALALLVWAVAATTQGKRGR